MHEMILWSRISPARLTQDDEMSWKERRKENSSKLKRHNQGHKTHTHTHTQIAAEVRVDLDVRRSMRKCAPDIVNCSCDVFDVRCCSYESCEETCVSWAFD